MPRTGKEIQTPDGVGIAVENNAITERTRVRLTMPDGTVELRTDSETEREQRKYHLRAMLVREMRTMPERGDPEEEL